MIRYELEREGSVYAIMDTFSGQLVEQAVLRVPERFRSERRARRRMEELEQRRHRAGAQGVIGVESPVAWHDERAGGLRAERRWCDEAPSERDSRTDHPSR